MEFYIHQSYDVKKNHTAETMESVKEFVQSISNNVKDKYRSPFYGAFFVCWVTFNWKPISIFIFSNHDIFFTIEYLEGYSSLQNKLCYPLLSALVLMFVIPLFHAVYAYFISFASNISESGEDFKQELKNNARAKRENSRKLADKIQEAKLAEQEANIAKSNKIKAEYELKLKKASSEINSINEVINEREKLQDEKDMLDDINAQLNKRVSHLENSVRSLIKGDEPNAGHLPIDWSGPSKIREFEKLTLERMRGSNDKQ